MSAFAGLRADLAPSSPFLPAGTLSMSSSGSPAALELRGIMSSGEGTSYYIYDRARKSSRWLMLDESGDGFVVKSADSANDSVVVEVQGRELTLPLKSSKIASTGALQAGALASYPAQGALAPGAAREPTDAEKEALHAIYAEAHRRLQEKVKLTATVPSAGRPSS